MKIMGKVAWLILVVVVSVCVVSCVLCCFQNNPVFLSVTIFHILKNENYELCFLANFFVDQITTGKNYKRKKGNVLVFLASVLECHHISYFEKWKLWAMFFGRFLHWWNYDWKKLRQEKKGTPNLSRYNYVVVLVFLLWFPPNLSCLQNNPPENNVEPVPAKSELPPKQSFGKLCGSFGGNSLHIIFRRIVLGSSSFRLN